MEAVIINPQVETAQLSLINPTEVFGILKSMYIGRVFSNDIYRALFKFPISMIPEECTILKAVLKVYVQGSGLGDLNSFTPFALDEDWCICNVAWDNQPSFNIEITGETTKINKVDFYTFNITQIVQKWYKREIPNYGIIMIGEEGYNSTYKRITTIPNSNLGPTVEITYSSASHCIQPPCTTRFIEKSEIIDTSELFRFSTIINISLTKTITYHIENLGNSTVEIFLQLSADGIHFLNDSPVSTKIPGKELIYLIPYTFAKFAKIAVRNTGIGETSRIKIWYQAQEE